MLLTRHRKLRKSTIVNLKNFIAFCKIRIKSIPASQQKLMRMYVDHTYRLLNHKPISNMQVNNLLAYMRNKMQDRKVCPYTNNYCLSDFPNSISPKECTRDGPCILIV